MNTAIQTATKRTITFTIDGERYANLERVAIAMNKVSWCDSDNSPETVLRAFVLPWAENLLDSPYELCDTILDGIATDDEGLGEAPGLIHKARLAELKAAFAAEGLALPGGAHEV